MRDTSFVYSNEQQLGSFRSDLPTLRAYYPNNLDSSLGEARQYLPNRRQNAKTLRSNSVARTTQA